MPSAAAPSPSPRSQISQAGRQMAAEFPPQPRHVALAGSLFNLELHEPEREPSSQVLHRASRHEKPAKDGEEAAELLREALSSAKSSLFACRMGEEGQQDRRKHPDIAWRVQLGLSEP